MSKNIRGSMLLFIAALIWGSSFIVMKNAVDFLTPAVLLSIRFVLASVFLSILFYKKVRDFPKDKIKGGLLTGCCLFLAYYVQTWGLNFTTPGKNAFLTAVYCAIVPFLVWFLYHKRPDIYNFIAAFVCVIGIGCVSLNGDLSINIGDLLTLCGGVLYAIHIIMIQKFSEGLDGGAFTTFQFIGGSMLALIVAFLSEDVSIVTMIQPSIFLQIFYLAFFATAVTMVCQTIGQKNTDECYASLILSLESVFGVLFSVLFYGEVLTLKVVIGFILIFIAIVISETKLSFLKPSRAIKIFMIFGLLFASIPLKDVQAKENVSLLAPYAYVYNISTDQLIYAKNEDQKIYPASMTKVMSVLVALDHMDDLNKVVTIENEDLKGLYEAGASVANFVVGEKVTYQDLIYAMILPSGADACQAVERVVFGGKKAMVEAMNQKAKALGLNNTHFENTTGLHHNNHYTTVHDMGVITKTALKNPFFKEVFTTRSYKTQTTGHYMAASILKVYWRTHMGISHIKGCKTGYTDESKSCITCLVQSKGNDIICVFAKEDGSDKYVKDAKSVIEYCDNHYHSITVYKKDEVIDEIKIKDGVKENYQIKATENIKVYVDKNVNKEDLKVEYVGKQSLTAPTKAKTQLGSVKIYCQDDLLKQVNITMNENIDATRLAKFFRFIKKNILIILIVIVGTILIALKVYQKKLKRKHKKVQKNK